MNNLQKKYLLDLVDKFVRNQTSAKDSLQSIQSSVRSMAVSLEKICEANEEYPTDANKCPHCYLEMSVMSFGFDCAGCGMVLYDKEKIESVKFKKQKNNGR